MKRLRATTPGVLVWAALLGVLTVARAAAGDPAPTLQQQLAKEGPAALAQAARAQGDAGRGAVVFFRPALACTRCHTAGEGRILLGPDLADIGKEATDAYLVESVLAPSRGIKKGVETVAVTTTDGRQLTGLVAEERPDAVVLRDAAQDGKPITIPKKEIDRRTTPGTSLMPEGLVNMLSRRQEVIDAFPSRDTADLFTEVSRGIDKWLWFVEEHLQAERWTSSSVPQRSGQDFCSP
jgi:putative heme-binding domain-containing protein